ncbi:MAG: hypothetical protein NT075_37755 [Chloroflexi bacterium]|nr:hypothetical protein [Chloroflexota bacterium]
MKKLRINAHWAILLLLMGLLTACLASLHTLDAPEQQGDVQVLAPAPTKAATLDQPTADTYALTLTARPTFPPTPEPTFYTPNPLNAEGTPKTATPMPATLMPGQTPATMPPPPTIQVGKTVDLAQGTPVPLNEVIAQSVRRADGKYDTYLIPPWLFLGSGSEINIRLNQLMEIKPGDEALGWTNAEQAAQLSGKPTATPIPTQPLHKIVDLAYGTPVTDGEMIVMHVRRADGTYDEYWLPLSLLKGTSAEINARLDQLMAIQPGDERFWWRTVVDPVTLHTLPTLVSTPTP